MSGMSGHRGTAARGTAPRIAGAGRRGRRACGAPARNVTVAILADPRSGSSIPLSVAGVDEIVAVKSAAAEFDPTPSSPRSAH